MSKLVEAAFAGQHIGIADLESIDDAFMNGLKPRDRELIRRLRQTVGDVINCEAEVDQAIAQLSTALGRVRGQRAQGNSSQFANFMIVEKAQAAERKDRTLGAALSRLNAYVELFAALLFSIDLEDE